jgi:hypothetical protein
VNDRSHVNVDGDTMTGRLDIDAEFDALVVTTTVPDGTQTRAPAITARSNAPSGPALLGVSEADESTASIGVQGESRGFTGTGVVGVGLNPDGQTRGGGFFTQSRSGIGAHGVASNPEGNGRGLMGDTSAAGGIGVQARALSATGRSFGLFAQNRSDRGTGLEVFQQTAGPDTIALVARHVGGEGTIATFRTNSTVHYRIDTDGDVTQTGTHFAEDHVNTSDQRLKKDITAVDGVLPKLEQIRSVRFRFKDDDESSGYHLGLLAQEVEAVFPELVRERGDGYLGVSYGHMTAVLLQAIKEQQRLIEAQQARIDAQQASIDALLAVREDPRSPGTRTAAQTVAKAGSRRP